MPWLQDGWKDGEKKNLARLNFNNLKQRGLPQRSARSSVSTLGPVYHKKKSTLTQHSQAYDGVEQKLQEDEPWTTQSVEAWTTSVTHEN